MFNYYKRMTLTEIMDLPMYLFHTWFWLAKQAEMQMSDKEKEQKKLADALEEERG